MLEIEVTPVCDGCGFKGEKLSVLKVLTTKDGANFLPSGTEMLDSLVETGWIKVQTSLWRALPTRQASYPTMYWIDIEALLCPKCKEIFTNLIVAPAKTLKYS